MNFDNLWNAIITLFFLSNGDGWVEIMYNGVDVNGVGNNPKQNSAEYLLLFFIGFFIVGNFFLMNLFIGVVVDNYQRMMVLFSRMGPDMTSHEDEDPEELLADYDSEDEAERQRQLEVERADYAAEEAAAELREQVPLPEEVPGLDPHRRKALEFMSRPLFDLLVAVAILSNIVLMATEHYDMSDGFSSFLDIGNMFFTVLFALEAIFKCWVLRCSLYLRSYWNRFDLFVVVISVISLVLDYALDNTSVNPTVLRVLRVFRIARILRLLKGAEGLRALIETVLKSFPQVLPLSLESNRSESLWPMYRWVTWRLYSF